MGERPDRLDDATDRLDDATDGYDAVTVETVDSSAAGDDVETEEIEVEIDQTRAEMTETIEAIGEKLTPGSIVDSAKEATVGKVGGMARSARYTAQDTGQGLVETIKENPVPAAMAAVGIGWLLMRRGGGTSQRQYRYYDTEDTDFYYEEQGSTGPGVGERAGEVAGTAKQRVGDVAGTAQERVGQVAGTAQQRVGELAGTAQQRVGDVATTAQQRAGQVAERARSGAEQARTQFDRMIEENPLALGAVAAAIGLGAGLVVPSTRREHELLGEKRDQMLDKAQQVTEEKVEQVRQSVEQPS